MKTIFGSRIDQSLARLSIFLIMAALIAGMAGCDGCGYGGYYPIPPPSHNLEIRTWYDLDAVRYNPAGNHTLINDLDSSTDGYEELASPTANEGKGWEPIATYIPEWGFMGFMGTFDGQGYEIRDLFINRPDENRVGLFRSIVLAEQYGVYGEGFIENIGVVNATVSGKDQVGGLVGHNDGTVRNSYFTGALTGDEHVGGLVGRNAEIVSNSYSSGSVTGNDAVGGLVGWNNYYTTLSNSHSSSSVTGNNAIGGLVGANAYAGTVSDSYFTGSVIGDTEIGGLVGRIAYGTVSNSYYNYDEVFINNDNIITTGALLSEDFEEWLANDKFLHVTERLSQESGYYLINNVSDFKQLLAFGQNDLLKFRLTNDLDLATEPGFYVPYLAGEFDGNDHKIANLSLNSDLVAPLGLFGYLAPGGKVANVGVENANITGWEAVGGLVGYTWEGTVSDSYSHGSVTGYEVIGGLVGGNLYGTVSNSSSSGRVTGTGWVGGLVGINGGTATVDSSYSTGSVNGDEHVGGLVGINYGTVSNSHSSGSVTGYEVIGGLVGGNLYGTVSNSSSSGRVTGTGWVGGLVGINGGTATVDSSYSTGSVNGDEHVGGLVGNNEGEATVSNSFWDIETSGQAASDGGTGRTTAEMKSIATFSGAGWNIIAVGVPGERNLSYIWNIVDDETYPFLSWQP
jgi:hypothetical protein